MADLRPALETIPRLARIAFAAGCAERAIIAYELEQYGDSKPLHEAVDAAWNAALGVAPEAAAIQALEERVRSVTPVIDEDPDHEPSALAGMSVIFALRAIRDATGKTAARAASLEIACFAAITEDAATTIEEDWQARALARVSAPGAPLTRDTLRSLPPPPPRDLYVPAAE
jgi:hypothetical protein